MRVAKGVAWIYRILDSLHEQESMESWEGQKDEGNKQVKSWCIVQLGPILKSKTQGLGQSRTLNLVWEPPTHP